MTDEKTSEGSAGSPSQSGEAQRVWAIEYLAGEDVPLYSLDELATHLADFIPYLESNSEHLIKFGLPQWRFGPNKWLYYQLGRLYDVKKTDFPWPCYGNKAPTPEQLAKMPAYRWIKDAPVGEARPSLGYAYRYCYCSYGEAALLRCVDAKAAQRLEAGRPNLLALKIATLRVLERALRERDSSKLWNECLGLLRKHRITTDVSETDFFFRMDQEYMPSDVFSDEMADASLKMIPGGLSNLLEVVGHCEKEITLGTLAVTREALEGIINPNKSDQGRFRIRRKHRGEHYAWFVGRPEKSQLDEALDHFLRLWKREPKWWAEYRDRVRKALPSEIHEDFLISTRVLRHHVPQFKAAVEPFVKLQGASLAEIGEPLGWMPGAIGSAPPTSDTRGIFNTGSSPPTDVDLASAKKKRTGKTAAVEKRSWTQSDLDDAILDLKARRSSRYSELIREVKMGSPGAKKAAREMFGRNAVARALGVKSRAMVTKSTAWKEMAKELDLDCKETRRGRTPRGRKQALEIALEEAAAPDASSVPSTVQQKELMEKHGVLLGRIRKINESITDTEQKKVLRGYAQDLIYEKMSPDEIKDLLTQFEQQQREGRT